MKAAVVLNSETWMMAWGCALKRLATAASTLSLLTGTKAEATSGGSLSSLDGLVDGRQARAAHGVVFGQHGDAVWPSVAQWRTILKASSAMLGRTWNTWLLVASRKASDAANGPKKMAFSELGHRGAGVGAGGADKAEQHISAVFQQLLGVGGGLARVRSRHRAGAARNSSRGCSCGR
jgi:hypothetical protein